MIAGLPTGHGYKQQIIRTRLMLSLNGWLEPAVSLDTGSPPGEKTIAPLLETERKWQVKM
jgi:hypothetical protein